MLVMDFRNLDWSIMKKDAYEVFAYWLDEKPLKYKNRHQEKSVCQFIKIHKSDQC